MMISKKMLEEINEINGTMETANEYNDKVAEIVSGEHVTMKLSTMRAIHVVRAGDYVAQLTTRTIKGQKTITGINVYDLSKPKVPWVGTYRMEDGRLVER